MRTAVKQLAELALLHGGPAAVSRRRWRRGALILAYHNVLPAGRLEGGADRSLHLPQPEFARQLDHLTSRCEVVPLADLMTGRTPEGRPLVAITFDDGYAGALSAGLEELVARNLPATFFLAPGCLGGQAFWWDRYVERDGHPLTPGTREYLVEELAGQNDAIRGWATTNLREVPVPDAARTATIADLYRAARVPGTSFGAHTWSHPNLARLELPALDSELRDPLTWIEQHLGSPVPALAFPYGRYSESITKLMASAGYRTGLAITGGWIRAGGGGLDQQVLARLNVSRGLSQAGFALRLAGVFA